MQEFWQTYRRYIILSGLVIVALVCLILWLLTSKLVITVPTDAKIFVKQGETGFSEIGTGEAKYKTRSTGPVYIEARKNDQVTQKSIIPKRRQTIQVNLELKPVVASKYIAPGPFTSPLIENGFVYGINPQTNSLDVEALEENPAEPPRSKLLPFLKQILWFDSNNYIYLTKGRGAGSVVGGEILDSHSNRFYSSLAVNNDTVALADGSGLYLARGIDIDDNTKIADPVKFSAPLVLSAGENFYYSSLVYEPGDYDEADIPPPKETKLSVFDSSGKKTQELTIPLKESVHRVASINQSTLGLLTDNGLQILDTDSGSLQSQTFSFGKVRDLVTVNNRLLLLGESGLWEYNHSSSVYYKVASYPDGEEYVANSLSLLNGSIYFSTAAKKEELLKRETKAKNAVYQLQL